MCYRLYTEKDFLKLKEDTVPEIKRCNLASEILQLKAIGIEDPTKFDFIESPSIDASMYSAHLPSPDYVQLRKR